MRWRRVVECIAGLGVVACGSNATPQVRAPSLQDVGAASCAKAARNHSPLLVEWSASEKANLEANLASGAIAVEYTGCEMRLLAGCELPGSYRWQRTTTATDVLDIDNQDELHTLLPLGALRLEGELSRSGKLSVNTTVGGQMRLSAPPPDVPETGPCSRATHVLHAVSIGAFSLDSGAAVGSELGASSGVIGAGAASQDRESVLRRAGNMQSCALATEEAPHLDCRSPVQAFLTPLPRAQVDQGPPGSVKATFVSSNADLRWEVRQNQETLCTTPCTRWVHPTETLRLRAYDRNGAPSPRGDTIDLPSLTEFSPGQALHVTAEPRSTGAFTGGIVTAGLGGAAMFLGGFLGLFGHIADEDGLATGGWVTAGAGAGLAAAGVVSIVLSAPDAEVSAQQVGYAGTGAPTFRVGGRF